MDNILLNDWSFFTIESNSIPILICQFANINVIYSHNKIYISTQSFKHNEQLHIKTSGDKEKRNE